MRRPINSRVRPGIVFTPTFPRTSNSVHRLPIGILGPQFRLIAPDLAGFGYTQVPDGTAFSREVWLQQIVDLLDALGLAKVSVVGNSFGGSMALALAIHHPERVELLGEVASRVLGLA